jgi:hypothetical protein
MMRDLQQMSQMKRNQMQVKMEKPNKSLQRKKLHHLQCVVIAVRGTETLEDLLTDVLCRECMLSEVDLDGLLNSSIDLQKQLRPYMQGIQFKQKVMKL